MEYDVKSTLRADALNACQTFSASFASIYKVVNDLISQYEYVSNALEQKCSECEKYRQELAKYKSKF